ncbi:MAG: antitoxin [Acidobacteria bacterium RIFCSPLOWO2_02_FULL_68_18]|nr:MAG: antitoxin [Acidobacteria bacterium RIFCSPLOWO2_02_FULL_68_18]OFW48012.1 MAG: antitoxin [Acidobacteria bacterium RIFCSPLOWO2_12_FULL_68_19]
MAKRLQVLLEEAEWRELRRTARAERTTVAEWVRRALRSAQRQASPKDADRKLSAIRRAARHRFPTADLAQMHAEIERGYLGSATP